MIYSSIRKLMFQMEPEKAHHFAMSSLQNICAIPPLKAFLKNNCTAYNHTLKTQAFGLSFENPIGLGAGFDKNALYLRELDALGFGSMEIGTVTPVGQSGNPTPRLFRLPEDKALINRMGFNNDGVDMIRKRLELWRTGLGQKSKMIIGGNIGKNKITPNENAVQDYLKCYEALTETVDYFVVNVSSPNTPGLRELQEKDALTKILSELQNLNHRTNQPKPILLKIAPDLTQEQLDDIIQISIDTELAGLVATNTTISRSGLVTTQKKIEEIGMGGLSGKPVFDISNKVLQYLHKPLSAYNIPIIASGGIFTGEDAKQKLANGASLVQIWTGFIYEGPMIVKNICKYLSNAI